MDDCDKEKKLLSDLDGMEWESWLAMIQWAAATLCRDNPRLLAEIIIRRGMKRAKSLNYLDADGQLDHVAGVFAEVGVKLSV